MTRIVERLRENAVWFRGEPDVIGPSVKLLVEEAADEIDRLRAALDAWMDAVRIDVTMEGPHHMGVSSTLGRKAWELSRAALGEKA